MVCFRFFRMFLMILLGVSFFNTPAFAASTAGNACQALNKVAMEKAMKDGMTEFEKIKDPDTSTIDSCLGGINGSFNLSLGVPDIVGMLKDKACSLAKQQVSNINNQINNAINGYQNKIPDILKQNQNSSDQNINKIKSVADKIWGFVK